jgi:glycosyltransferase involved in cell wall biosynthesis
VAPSTAGGEFAAIGRLAREGARPLAPGGAAAADAERLRVAVVIPPFRRGAGGHNTIARLVRGLAARGHECSLWLDDPARRHAGQSEAEVAELLREFFGPLDGVEIRKGLERWEGADVAVATGWQTVHPALLLDGCRARAYLVQDHEPEFYATSAQAEWAAQTYGLGLHCIAAGRWLADTVRDRYGATASHFELGVDHAVYRPQDVARAPRRVIFYARAVTERRAVPLGLLALAELHRRRPDVEIELFGDPEPPAASFPHRHLGVLSDAALAKAYSAATAGLVLSMTNYSLVPQEMLACGLPCVDLDRPSVVSAFGADGPVELAAFDPLEVASALERVIDDPELRERRARAGLALVAERTWEAAAEAVEAGLREALQLAG